MLTPMLSFFEVTQWLTYNKVVFVISMTVLFSLLVNCFNQNLVKLQRVQDDLDCVVCNSNRNISWTTVTEPALAASPAVDQLQTSQTLLSGYFFPTARLPRWFDQRIQTVLSAAIIHTEVSVSSAAQLGRCCSSFLSCCSETLELSWTELSNCSIR